MPKCHGWRERRPFDFYDCFSPKGDPDENGLAITLFGNANIGIGHLSNLQVPGRLASDQTAVICNWYARTNMPVPPTFVHPSYTPHPDVRATPFEQAFVEFASMTLVTMVVGEKPVTELSLDQLLRRRHGERTIVADDHQLYGRIEQLAAFMYERYRMAGGTGIRWEELPDVAPLGTDGQLGKRPWIAAADAAVEVLREPVVTIVPVRQNVRALVEFNPQARNKLRELMPPGIAPMPLVWIHYEGFAIRDVA